MPFLSGPERAELEAILVATPEPVEIICTAVCPDGTVASYSVWQPGVGPVELDVAEIADRGLEPIGSQSARE